MQIIRKLTIMSPFTVMGIWGFVKSNSEDKTQIATKELLAKADTLFDQGDYKNIYNLLSNYKVIIFSNLYNAFTFSLIYTIIMYMSRKQLTYNCNMSFILYRIVRMLKSYGV